jgi:LysR family transcriptional activator of nhaA
MGCELLKPAGRGLSLTEAGIAAMQQADQIFQLGEGLPHLVRDAAATPGVRLWVGISDGLPKLVVHRLLQPIINEPRLRLLCMEGQFNDLLGNLALHKLDLVISDRPAPSNPNIKLYSHALGSSSIAWYGTAALLAKSAKIFPHNLDELPVLLPTAHTVMRDRLEHWFEQHQLKPHVVGEFEDSALLKTFGASGMGVFPVVESVQEELMSHYAVQRMGHSSGVTEHFYAIGTEKKVQHPLVQRLLHPNPT